MAVTSEQDTTGGSHRIEQDIAGGSQFGAGYC